MIYSVYKREFQMRYNGIGYFMGDVLEVHLHTQWKLKAIVYAWLTGCKWCDGKVVSGMPKAKKIRPSLRLLYASWRMRRAIKKMVEEGGEND